MGDSRKRVADLHAIREQVRRGPGDRATEAQKLKGKLTARERIDLLLDEGSSNEIERLRRHRATGFGPEAKKPYVDGVITDWGTAPGAVVAQSLTCCGGQTQATFRDPWQSRLILRWTRVMSSPNPSRTLATAEARPPAPSTPC
ncbi:hypothetical protein OG607_14145 [Streptomyces sp. NBC_01537]|uniref:carboxyl transferase domain-containing protein n=1 Tax=Streptomyces sp. NBC_01537 TaxID=2903896 RepID=UPI00386AA3E3